MKNILVLLMSLAALAVHAERIDGPANIRDTPKGETTFSLNDFVEVDISPLQGGWYELVIGIQLTKEQYEMNPTILNKGTRLYNNSNEEIGVVLADIRVSGKMTAGGAPGIPKWYGAELHGYTFKSNIRPESIIEPVVSQLISSNKANLTRQAFQKHLKEFNYQDGLAIRDMPQYDTYMVHESTLDDPSPLDRIRLIFHGEKLVAIVHSRELQLTDYETIPIQRERKLTLLAHFDDKEKRNFIEKNNASYAGVD